MNNHKSSQLTHNTKYTINIPVKLELECTDLTQVINEAGDLNDKNPNHDDD